MPVCLYLQLYLFSYLRHPCLGYRYKNMEGHHLFLQKCNQTKHRPFRLSIFHSILHYFHYFRKVAQFSLVGISKTVCIHPTGTKKNDSKFYLHWFLCNLFKFSILYLFILCLRYSYMKINIHILEVHAIIKWAIKITQRPPVYRIREQFVPTFPFWWPSNLFLIRGTTNYTITSITLHINLYMRAFSSMGQSPQSKIAESNGMWHFNLNRYWWPALQKVCSNSYSPQQCVKCFSPCIFTDLGITTLQLVPIQCVGWEIFNGSFVCKWGHWPRWPLNSFYLVSMILWLSVFRAHLVQLCLVRLH